MVGEGHGGDWMGGACTGATGAVDNCAAMGCRYCLVPTGSCMTRVSRMLQAEQTHAFEVCASWGEAGRPVG